MEKESQVSFWYEKTSKVLLSIIESISKVYQYS